MMTTTCLTSPLMLAERLARNESLAPELLSREKFKHFHAWAKAILDKTVPPPPWLAELIPYFRDPELNKPSKNPNRLTVSRRHTLERTRFACKLELTTPLPSFGRLPQPDKPPTRTEIELLARSLDQDVLKKELMYFPQWADYFKNDPWEQECRARNEAQAERILKGKEAPPRWLVRKAPHLWIPRQRVKTLPAPSNIAEAEAHFRRNRFPLMAAWILKAAFPPPPPPPEERPPPRPPPQRETGEENQTLRFPRATEVFLWEINHFDNRIAV